MAKLMIVLNRIVIGGAPADTVQLAGALSREHETCLVSGAKVEDEKDAAYLLSDLKHIRHLEIKSMRRSINPLYDWQAYCELKKIIRSERPDIIHTHGAKPGFLARLAASRSGVPVIVHTYHGHIFHSYFNKLASFFFVAVERWLARKSSAIIVLSESQKQEIANCYRICPAEKISVIPLGLDIEPFVNGQDEKRQRFRKKYGLEENESAIGLVGRIVKVKNHGFFLQVASRLSKEMKREVKFFIVGDGNLRKKLEAEAVALQLEPVSLLTSKEGKLVFTSWIREIDEVMAGLDIVTLTSFNEGTPVSLLEAQAAGKPIVAINVGGTADTMLDEESGFLLKDFDSDLFAQKLEWLVRHKSEAIQMGRKGREYVKSTHPFKLQVEKTLQLYKSLLSNLKGSPNLRTG